jgi:hypothetical protein
MTDTTTAGRIRHIGSLYVLAEQAISKRDEAALDAAISNLFEATAVLESERRLERHARERT